MRETTSRREEECKDGVSFSGWGQQHRKHCQHTYDGSLEHQEGVFLRNASSHILACTL